MQNLVAATTAEELRGEKPANLTRRRRTNILRGNRTSRFVGGKPSEAELVLPGPPVILPELNPTSNISNILDAAVKHLLPIIYPARFPRMLSGAALPCEIEVAQWSHPVIRIGPNAESPENGGRTVQAKWPDLSLNLTYIPILKNAHTTLLNAFGDLRQRIQGAKVLLHSKPKKPTLILNESLVIITVLRDPIARFISGTCEDLRQQRGIFKCFLTDDLNASINCILRQLTIHRRNETQFSAHQRPQANQLKTVMNGIDKPISVISFDQLVQLMQAIGAKSSISRDRTSLTYLQSMPKRTKKKNTTRILVDSRQSQATRELALERLGGFCKIHGKSLTSSQLDILCKVYMHDVQLLRAVGMDVPLCG
jgi:hypothetical protein